MLMLQVADKSISSVLHEVDEVFLTLILVETQVEVITEDPSSKPTVRMV